MNTEDDDLPRLLDGRYRLEGTLGHGGMGIVYRGVDLMMKRSIAVKLVRGADGVPIDDEIAGRFLREAKNTARLQHEHIIEIFDLGRTSDAMYFVMELLEGESLSARLKREGALSPQQTVHIGRQICEALGVAHAFGIIHRDLKPANIMLLSRAGDDDYVKVLDFGVAKSLATDGEDTQLTRTGMLVGTVDYMAPEQIMGKPVDGRTDVYALGVVLYKMLLGKAPFRDSGVPALIHAHLNTMPTPLAELGVDVPGDLDRVVLRCLAKNPDRRYESMQELARALVSAITPPESLRLMSLEYRGGDDDEPDPYAGDTRTEVSSFVDPLPPPDDPTERMESSESDFISEEEAFAIDDSTLKIDRDLDLKKPLDKGRLPMTPRKTGGGAPKDRPSFRLGGDAPPIRGRDLQRGGGRAREPSEPDEDDMSTAKRTVAEEITRIDRTEAKTCSMCQTLNAPHARACVACGVALTARAVIRPASIPPPALSPHATPAPNSKIPPPAQPSGPSLPQPLGPPQYIPSAPPSGSAPMPLPSNPPPNWLPSQPPPPEDDEPSMWERFLSWTGIRHHR